MNKWEYNPSTALSYPIAFAGEFGLAQPVPMRMRRWATLDRPPEPVIGPRHSASKTRVNALAASYAVLESPKRVSAKAEGASPNPVCLDSGLGPSGRPGMTAEGFSPSLSNELEIVLVQVCQADVLQRDGVRRIERDHHVAADLGARRLHRGEVGEQAASRQISEKTLPIASPANHLREGL